MQRASVIAKYTPSEKVSRMSADGRKRICFQKKKTEESNTCKIKPQWLS